MTKLFRHFDDALNYVLQFNHHEEDLIAVNLDGDVFWIEHKQIILFSVITMKKISTLCLLDIFIDTICMPIICQNLISEYILNLIDNNYDAQIVSISEWSLLLKVGICDKNMLTNLIEKSNKLNLVLAKHMSEKHGTMRAVKCQSRIGFKEQNLICIGVR